MRGKCQFWFHLFLILSLIIITATVNLSPVYAQLTLRVDPPAIIDETKTPSTTFTINITVIEVADLVSFAFKLKFDTTILDATAITKGAFFEGNIGSPPNGPVIQLHKEINNDVGYVSYSLGFGFLSPYFESGKDGSGTLATIEFVVEEVGVTLLDLSDTDLTDPVGVSMPHEVDDGYFSNTGYANPIAEFTFDPPSPILGETVTFISGSYDIDGYIVSWDWDFGDGATGNEEIVEHVYTDARGGTQTVTLTVTDNEGLTNTATKTVPVSGHNLAVINVQPNQTYVMQNRTISISVTVKNKGSETERLNVTAYYNATPVAPLQTQLLAPKYEKTLPFFWNTSGVAEGTYIISANVTHWPEPYDPDDVETILNDNSLSADGTVTVVLTPVHDIAVIDIATSVTMVFVGDNVNINVTVANQGFTPETFNASMYYDTNLIERKTNVTIPALTSETLTFTWNTTGVHWGAYSISANVSVVLDEMNRANNNLTDGTVGVALHNINVSTLSAPTSAVVGTKVKIEAVIKNEGRQNATFTVSFHHDNTWITNQTVEDLTPSATTNLTVLWDTTSVATGPHTIRVKAAQLEGELVVTDNERTQLVSLIPKVHNIAVTGVTADPNTVIRGKTVDIRVTIQNQGNMDENISVSVYYDTTLIETKTGVLLPVGESKTLNFTWNTPANIALKTYTIKAETPQLPGETNTTDNTKTTQITLVMHEITVVSVTTSKTEATVGESVTVTVIVKNEGNFSESFSVTAKYNDHIIETSINVNNLAKGQSETVTFTWNTAGVSPGTYKIKATASAVTDEDNKTNNTKEDGTVTVNDVSPLGIPVYVILAVGVAIILVIALIVFARRREQKP